MFNTTDLGYSSLFVIFSLAFFMTSLCSCLSLTIHSLTAIDQIAFQSAVATWYGNPTGAGSDGGACGYGNDVAKPPFSAMVSAGNEYLFRQGKGCGSCYQVKCTENPACSGNPITVTITDECPCDTDATRFDLSGTAFGAMALPDQADLLRNAGALNVQHKRVPCDYHNMPVVFTIDPGSNPFYFACVIKYEEGDGDLAAVQLQVANDSSDTWLPMQQSWGATWKIDLPPGINAPFSIKLTTLETSQTIVANNVIPADWAPGRSYSSAVNF